MVLYSFRRCPYAMRARLALHLSQLNPQIREIELKNKPSEMLAVSPKGTVPVLVNGDDVIDESLNIMRFSLLQHPNPNCEYLTQAQYQVLLQSIENASANELIKRHDEEFKGWLDKYKYADRHPQMSQTEYRLQAEAFIQQLEDKLLENEYLFAASPTFADFAIFPFIRQFANVDPKWFNNSHYPNVINWLLKLVNSQLFGQVMKKYPLWLDKKQLTNLKI
ncbi:glutathione S-transferase [Shewanella gaetbuli]